jgi:hypothetical protein
MYVLVGMTKDAVTVGQNGPHGVEILETMSAIRARWLSQALLNCAMVLEGNGMDRPAAERRMTEVRNLEA